MSVVIKPQNFVDADDVLTPEEAKLLRKAERQMLRGQSTTLSALDLELDRASRRRHHHD